MWATLTRRNPRWKPCWNPVSSAGRWFASSEPMVRHVSFTLYGRRKARTWNRFRTLSQTRRRRSSPAWRWNDGPDIHSQTLAARPGRECTDGRTLRAPVTGDESRGERTQGTADSGEDRGVEEGGRNTRAVHGRHAARVHAGRQLQGDLEGPRHAQHQGVLGRGSHEGPQRRGPQDPGPAPDTRALPPRQSELLVRSTAPRLQEGRSQGDHV